MPTPMIFLRDISDLSELEGDDDEIVIVEPTEEERQTIGQYFRTLDGEKLYSALYERMKEEMRDFTIDDEEMSIILDEIKSRLERFDVLDASERMRQAKERYDIARSSAISTGR